MKRILFWIFPLCLMLLMSGCSGDAPLSKRVIVQNAGVDKADGQYRLSLNAFVAEEAGEENPDITSTQFFTRSGDTIVDAIANLGLVTGRIPFFSHNEVVVIGEDTAKESIADPMGFFMEFFECRAGVSVFIAKGSAEEVIACKSSDTTVPAKNFQELAEIGKVSGKVIHKTVYDVGMAISNPAVDLCLPCVAVEEYEEDGETKKRLSSGDTALFRDDRLVGYLNEIQTKGYLILTNDVQHLSMDTKVKDYGTITVDFRSIQTDVQITLKDARPVIRVTVAADGEPVEKLNLNGKMLDNTFYELLRVESSRMLEQAMRECLEKSSQLRTDPYGFGAMVWSQYPDFWEAHSEEWRDLLAQADVSFSVHCNIRQIYKSLEE